MWNFGSLLGVCLIIQIVTGVTLAMHYNPSVLEAFNSLEHLILDVNNGCLIGFLNINTVLAFFLFLYVNILDDSYISYIKIISFFDFWLGLVTLKILSAVYIVGYVSSPHILPYLFLSLAPYHL
jgi:ubiquinol-cytochrome c reductase cytochrome b subunit